MNLESNNSFSKWVIPVGLFVYAVIYFIFYPPIYAFRDEANYFSMAYALREGSFFFNPAITPLHNFSELNGRFAPMYPIANSIAILPFTYLGWKAVFCYGLVCHLIATWLVSKLAKLFEIQPWLPALLYLFFPPYVFYSRTIMSDIPTTMLFLAACTYYFNPAKPKWVSGIFFGALIPLRTTNALLVIPFAICMVFRSLKEKSISTTLRFLLPTLPFVLFFAVCNTLYYGAPWMSGYTSPTQSFSLHSLLPHLVHYMINLNLMYPLMFVVFLFSKKLRKLEIGLTVALLLITFSFYMYHDRFPQRWMDLFFSSRFLLPIMPFFLLAYGHFLYDALEKLGVKARAVALGAGFIVLLSANIALQVTHQNRLTDQKKLSNQVYAVGSEEDTLVYDINTAELVQSVWGKRRYIPYTNIGSISDLLAKQDYSNNVYLAIRTVIYDQLPFNAIENSQIEDVRERFNLKTVLRSTALQLYEVSPKQGNRS